ncbi:NAD(P)-binding protein [Lepidopterella palustris CBS 459.81]|uniref:NAD(P)-binding protein n=1 Tax=Lepidopterella palustris CBS 459.81 TaxID=1314670 RepID=A0A8E2E3X4_9PEZI|nr:NAD(P)-binding protein [Lepidopterella palustris CBS 459.81]
MVFGFFESKTFNPSKDIPDLEGKVILVTGGNAGLGKESILQLAKHNPSRIYLAARTSSKAAAAIQEIKSAVPTADIEFLQLDLGSLKSVKQAADTFTNREGRLDILLNNAGLMAQPEGLTEDGYELQFGTNHMGHALLTKLLLPTLTRTASLPSTTSPPRVICLSSAAHQLAPRAGIDFSTLTTPMSAFSTWTRYGQSKAANILFASELARRNPELTCVSCHPGSVATGLSDAYKRDNKLLGIVFGWLIPILAVDVQQGARSQLWCATAKEVESGRFYYPVGVEHKGRGFPENKKLAGELWEWTEKQLEEKGY